MGTTTAGWVVPTQAGDVHTYDGGPDGFGVQATDHYGTGGIAVRDVAGHGTPADAAYAALDAGGPDGLA